MTTPNNHVLIDYENVQPEVASRLAPGFFKVWVFVGALQNKVKFDLRGRGRQVVRLEFHRCILAKLRRLCFDITSRPMHYVSTSACALQSGVLLHECRQVAAKEFCRTRPDLEALIQRRRHLRPRRYRITNHVYSPST